MNKPVSSLNDIIEMVKLSIRNLQFEKLFFEGTEYLKPETRKLADELIDRALWLLALYENHRREHDLNPLTNQDALPDVCGHCLQFRRDVGHINSQLLNVVSPNCSATCGLRCTRGHTLVPTDYRYKAALKSGRCPMRIKTDPWHYRTCGRALSPNDQAEASGARGRPIANPDAPAALPPAHGWASRSNSK